MLKTASHRPGGFTLIELMVVIILIGVVAAIVIPELGGSAETVRLEAAARRVSDMMDFCSRSAASSGRVHALLFDQTARRFDVVCEPVPAAPPAEAAPAGDAAAAPAPAEGDAAGSGDPSAAAGGPAAGATGDSATADPATDPAATSGVGGAAVPDQAAQLGLVRIPLPGFLNQALPDGVGLSALETYETDLSTGETEGQFKILFFPDGTTEFAKVELSLPTGQRRVVVLNGIGGTVSIFDPDRHGEVDMNTLITDEDNPVDDAASDTATEPGSEPGSGTGMSSGAGTMGGGMSDGGNSNLFGGPAGQ